MQKTIEMKGPGREQSRGEEIANSISHGLGVVAVSIGAPYLLVYAARQGNAAFIVGVGIFSLSALVLYLSSALYHALPSGNGKRICRDIEHAAIFLLIAGTYTPFTLGVLSGPWGWTLFGIVWGLAAVGVTLKLFARLSHPVISTCLYLAMGWLVVIVAGPLFERMPTTGLFWLVSGGISYTAGIGFFAYGWRLKYGHLIWHLFVLNGTVCHYFAVLWSVA